MREQDPMKDPEFQKVIKHFLNTPPKPHKPSNKTKPKQFRKSAAYAKPKTS